MQQRSMYIICPSYTPENNSIQLKKRTKLGIHVMMQAPKTKPTVLIALKFCTMQTLKFSSQFRGFSSPKIILHCFLADLKVHIYESETTYNGEANVTNVKENHSIVLIFSSTFTENVEKGRHNENNHNKTNTV